jgi:hypothetical protein
MESLEGQETVGHKLCNIPIQFPAHIYSAQRVEEREYHGPARWLH